MKTRRVRPGTVSFSVNDGAAASNIASRTITVNAVNDAAANTLPGPQDTAKNVARVFSSGNGHPISIADADAGGACR